MQRRAPNCLVTWGLCGNGVWCFDPHCFESVRLWPEKYFPIFWMKGRFWWRLHEYSCVTKQAALRRAFMRTIFQISLCENCSCASEACWELIWHTMTLFSLFIWRAGSKALMNRSVLCGLLSLWQQIVRLFGLDQRMQWWRDKKRRMKSRRARGTIREWKPGSEGSLKDASEARKAAENQVPVSGSCGRAWEKKTGRKKRKARQTNTENHKLSWQSWLMETSERKMGSSYWKRV